MISLPDGSRKCPIYFDRDKNRATIRREILTKRLSLLIKEGRPTDDIRPKRAEGIVELNRVPVAKIIIEGPIDFKIQWNLPQVSELNIDKDAMLTKLEAGSPASSAPVSWG